MLQARHTEALEEIRLTQFQGLNPSLAESLAQDCFRALYGFRTIIRKRMGCSLVVGHFKGDQDTLAENRPSEMDRVHQVDSILAMTSASLVFLTGLNFDLARRQFPEQSGFLIAFNAIFVALVLLLVPVCMLKQSWSLRRQVWFFTGVLLCYEIFMLVYTGASGVLAKLQLLSGLVEALLTLSFIPALFLVLNRWERLVANAYLTRLGPRSEKDRFEPHLTLENWVLQSDLLYVPGAILSSALSVMTLVLYVLGLMTGRLPLS